MVAIFEVFLDTGGVAGTPSDEDSVEGFGPPNIRFKRADDSVIDGANPNIIPVSGQTNSRWKQIYLKNIFAPDTQVDNVKIFTDGSDFGLGIDVEVGAETPIKNSGSSSGYDPSDLDDEDMVGHAGIVSHSDFFLFTSGSPKSVSISESGAIIDAVGETTDYIVLQMDVSNTATPGNLVDETITYEFDEI